MKPEGAANKVFLKHVSQFAATSGMYVDLTFRSGASLVPFDFWANVYPDSPRSSAD